MPDTLADTLESDIIFGAYAPGARLTEDSIMARYDAKRHTVRNAFAVLMRRGLLVHKRNRGVEVVSFTPDEVDALYDLRLILETAAAERTPLPGPPDLTMTMEEIARAHQVASKAGDFRGVFSLNLDFHRQQYSCCNNPRLVELIEEHARIVQPIRVIRYDDEAHMAQVVAQHFEIVDAMRGTSQSRYIAATRQHLPASARAFREFYERRFGKTSASI